MRIAVLLVAVGLAAGAAAQVAHTDPAGDVFRDLSTPVDEPRVDIVHVSADRYGDILHLRMDINGTLPVAGQVEAGADRTYRYLFPVIFDDQEGKRLLQDHDMTVLCEVKEGHDMRNCTVPQQEHFVRILAIHPRGGGFNVSLELMPDTPQGRLEAGGAATMSSDNGTRIEAQDFTDNALPFSVGPEGGTNDGGSEPSRPWWQSPWLLLVAAVVGVAAAVLWNRRQRA